MINGVVIKKLKVIPDERGRLMEILRSDEKIFEKFGQVYLSTVYKGVIKAWHYHKKQDDFVCCLKGMIKLVLYDNRNNSKTKGKIMELFIGEYNPCLVKIPKGIYHGWKGIKDTESYVINIPTETYNYKKPDEHRIDPYDNNIPYDWKRKDG